MSKKRFVDLSIAIEPGIPSDPPMMIPQVEYVDHSQGAEQMRMFFPGAEKNDLPGGLVWAMEFVSLTTHSGTHLDAPYHYHPRIQKDERSKGDLGGAFRGHRNRLLPYGEDGEPFRHREALRFHGLLFSRENQGCKRRLD